MTELQPPSTDYDSPWKEVLEHYFPQFMAFFFPAASAQIDWAQGYRFRDKELQQLIREAEIGRRYVDKLVEVYLLDGGEAWVLAHVEVQGEQEAKFPERMYVYNYRIYDKYSRPVASFAVLADDRMNWRPGSFEINVLGCRVLLDFPTAKLLDYQQRVIELEQDPNPFALVVLAHLNTQATRRNPQARYAAKLALFKMLYRRGYNRQEVIDLLRFIDWIMTLPKGLDKQFMDEIAQIEANESRPYVTSFERIAMRQGWEVGREEGREVGREEGREEGLRHSVIRALEFRFGTLPQEITLELEAVYDPAVLEAMLIAAISTDTLADFENRLNEEIDKT